LFTDADRLSKWLRYQRVWKYAMWDAGCRLPTNLPDGQSRCFCGAEINIRGAAQHVYAAHMETA
jgi:hypothetical protein